MQLTVREEGDLLLRYAPMAKKLIRDYCAACGMDVRTLGDDLLQEAYIVLLLQIRKVDCEKDIPFAKLNMLGAIYAALRRMETVRLPKHACKKIRNAYRYDPYEELCDTELVAEDDMLLTVAFSAFVAGLTEQERFVLSKKLEGCTNRELVRFGFPNEMAVSRILGRLKGELRALLAAR